MSPKPIKRIEDYDPDWKEELEKKQPKLQKFKIVDGAEGYPEEMWGKEIVLDMNRLADDMRTDIDGGKLIPEEFDTAIMAAARTATANLELTVPDPDTNAVLIDRSDIGLFVKEVLIGLAEASLLWTSPVVKLYRRLVKIPSRKIVEELRQDNADDLEMLVLRVKWFEPSAVFSEIEELRQAEPSVFMDITETFFTCGVIVNPGWEVADGMAYISDTDLDLVKSEFLEFDDEDDEDDEGHYGERYELEIDKISEEILDSLVNALISQGVSIVNEEASEVRVAITAIPQEDLEEIDGAIQMGVPQRYGSKIILATEL